MGIRSRLRNLVLGPSEPERAPAPPPERAPAPPPVRAPAPPPPVAAPAPKGKDDPEVRAKFDKIVAKAKLGVLKHVLDTSADGRMAMADMHDFSERRFFIAHRSFSDLMETWTGEGLVTYDPETGNVTVTDAGRAFVAQNRK
jgi:hypothetical protein